jgi:hypothetical protein
MAGWAIVMVLMCATPRSCVQGSVQGCVGVAEHTHQHVKCIKCIHIFVNMSGCSVYECYDDKNKANLVYVGVAFDNLFQSIALLCSRVYCNASEHAVKRARLCVGNP